MVKRRIMAEPSFTAEIPSLVADWFGNRGIAVRYRPGLASALTPIGRVDSDAEKRVTWLSQQVVPVVRGLQEWYSRGDLIALLFDGAGLSEIRPVQVGEDDDLAAYDRWTLEAAGELDGRSAIQT